jgi:predicted nucleic acid-binding protein
MAQKRGRYTTAQRMAFIEVLLQLPIEIEAPTARNVLDGQAALAERFGLTAYDAAYLDLALRRGLPLATQDKAMKSAATKAGVALVS